MQQPMPRQEVIVTNIDMPFWSMVGFMIKWTIAAIPAFLILTILGVVVAAVLAGFIGAVAIFGGAQMDMRDERMRPVLFLEAVSVLVCY